jgi:hypothetical protein
MLEKHKTVVNGSRFNLNCILWADTENFNGILELLLGKIKNCFPIARETRMNEGFMICYTLEDSIAISEPVMFGQ